MSEDFGFEELINASKSERRTSPEEAPQSLAPIVDDNWCQHVILAVLARTNIGVHAGRHIG